MIHDLVKCIIILDDSVSTQRGSSFYSRKVVFWGMNIGFHLEVC